MKLALRVGIHGLLWAAAMLWVLWFSHWQRDSLLVSVEEELQALTSEITEQARSWASAGDDEEFLLDTEDLWDLEDFADYRAAYIQRIEEILEEAEDEDEDEEQTTLLLARLHFLGEPVELEEAIHPQRVWHLMLEETPETLHDHLDHFTEAQREALDEYQGERSQPDAAMLHHWLREEYGEAEEFPGCIALLDEDRRRFFGNLREIPPVVFTLERGDDPGLLALFRILDEDEQAPCLARWLLFDDGSGALLGVEPPPGLAAIKHATTGSLIALSVLAAVACLLAYRRETRISLHHRAILALGQRAREGDFSIRLPVSGTDSEASFNREINSILEKAASLMERLNGVTANIAHDLRTPLTRLRGQLDLLLHASHRDPAIISAVQAEADQLLDTFNALLRISQVESGSLQASFRPFDLTALLRDACELYAPAFEEKSIHFDSQLPGQPVIVRGDMDLWMQSLSNLLDNALKYVPGGQSVQISLDAEARLVVADSGPGIPELELDKVLDRFYRLPKHRGERGSGLGLSLVAAVCKLHDASLTLRNQGGLVVEIGLKRGDGKGPR